MSRSLSLIALVAVLIMLAVTPAASQKNRPDAPTHIVVFNDGALRSDMKGAARALAHEYGFTATKVYKHALNGMAAVLTERHIERLQNDPRIAYVEPVYYASITAQTIPTGIMRIGAASNPAIDVDGNDERVNVDVAVIDTGIDLDHPDLNVVGGVTCNFKGRCSNGGDDGNGHGTHVAGTIGAKDNGIGVVGVAPGARLWAVRVLGNNGSGSTAQIIGGIDWVTARASTIEVANMSLGGQFTSASLDSAISRSVSAGVVYAVAAGNSDMNAASFSPASHPDVITVSALADFDGAPGSLGAPTCRVDQDDTLADFSNWGTTIEVTAPGVCIYSTWLNGGYNTISGTSMASPHVAGAAALLASLNNPNNRTNVLNIRSQIINTGSFDWVDDSGDGTLEPRLNVSTFGAGY